jgi:hypothetical protein
MFTRGEIDIHEIILVPYWITISSGGHAIIRPFNIVFHIRAIGSSNTTIDSLLSIGSVN